MFSCFSYSCFIFRSSHSLRKRSFGPYTQMCYLCFTNTRRSLLCAFRTLSKVYELIKILFFTQNKLETSSSFSHSLFEPCLPFHDLTSKFFSFLLILGTWTSQSVCLIHLQILIVKTSISTQYKTWSFSIASTQCGMLFHHLVPVTTSPSHCWHLYSQLRRQVRRKWSDYLNGTYTHSCYLPHVFKCWLC